jgi:hypothetical protein
MSTNFLRKQNIPRLIFKFFLCVVLGLELRAVTLSHPISHFL